MSTVSRRPAGELARERTRDLLDEQEALTRAIIQLAKLIGRR
jgi:hypothetical protein